MPLAPIFDFELSKALFALAAEAEFGVLGWPLSVLLVFRHYQNYVTFGLTASIIIAFFIGIVYSVQTELSTACFSYFAQRLQVSCVKTQREMGVARVTAWSCISLPRTW